MAKWIDAMLAGNRRERDRLRGEFAQIRGGIALLMKQRNGSRWTAQERQEILLIVRRVSALSPYLLIWALPGSVLILPFLAWHLDHRRQRRTGTPWRPENPDQC